MPEQEALAATQDTAQTSETESQEATTEQNAVTDTAQQQGAETEDEQKNQQTQEEERKKTEKRVSGWQKRVNELTRDKHAEREAREAIQRQNAELIALLKGNQGQPAKAVDGQPKPEQFEQYADFIRAEAAWNAEQTARKVLEDFTKQQAEAMQKAEAEKAERQAASAYMQRHREVAKRIPDFEQTMADGAHEINVPNSVFAMIQRIPEGPEIAYHMVKSPALAEQFFTNPPEMHGFLLGQLLATIKGSAKQVSSAPSPGKPVQSKPGSGSEPPEDTEAYMVWAAKHMR